MPMNPRLLRPLARRQVLPFSPSSIAGLALWLDGDDASSFTLNGSTISEWQDKSGNARHFSQPTASLQPAQAASVKNGKNAVAMTNDWLAGDYEYDIGTLFLVWEPPTTADGDGLPGIFSARSADADKAASGSLNLALNIHYTSVDVMFADPYVSGIYALNGSTASGAALLGFDNEGAATRTSPHRWQYLSVAFDEPVVGDKPIVLGADIYTFTERVMQNGHIGEVIAYESVLTESQIASVTNYLVAKWGLE